MRGAWGQTSTERKKNGKAKGRPVALRNGTRAIYCQFTFQLAVSHFAEKMKTTLFSR